MPIKIGNEVYRTISDVTEEFGGVSTKTIRTWIRDEIIPKPPKLDWGLRTVAHFPATYVQEAKAHLERYRKSKNDGKQ